ncbi:hypothetical protein AAFC00_004342 [Neodothiora populina]|uniref:Flap structure-specific endonuclease n=1 Tax=Neodothiora populina TaxID=2781224 RepID=A0ABR3PJG3_9PEZI
MGIHGIYDEIGDGRRVAVSKLSSEIYIARNRPFRLAIDISIWLFQIQSGKGGTNPALRTFYYRLLRLLQLNIHPLFVFDGPNKPKMKRNKRVGGPGIKVSSIPEFLAKQLLKNFGFPMHHAPGEAEAECASLQQQGIVDAVLSEDVDTLMFGSGMTLRKWKPEQGKTGKEPTHVTVHDAKTTKDVSGLDREGMVLVAMMSGGDYIPEGIPGCGPKLACEAARAGFGVDLCKLKKSDKEGIREWRERLRYEIRTNESKFFKQKRTALTIPDDFPNMEVLGYYTHPAISGPEKLQKLKDTLKWDAQIDFPSLREFAKDAFDWRCIGGAKHFIRKLAPAILMRELRIQGESTDQTSDDLEAQEANETRLINSIHGKRNHSSTDGELEFRVSFVPIKLINIDLSIEDLDEELPVDEDLDSDSEPSPSQVDPNEDVDGCPASPKKKRGPMTYDPNVPIKEWLLATFVKIGAPLKVQDYEAQFNDPKKFATRNASKTSKPRKKASDAGAKGGMARGALDRFAVTRKPNMDREQHEKPSCAVAEVDLSEIAAPQRRTRTAKGPGSKPDIRDYSKVTKSRATRMDPEKTCHFDEIDLSAINNLARERSEISAARESSLEKSRTAATVQQGSENITQPIKRTAKRQSPDAAPPCSKRRASPPRGAKNQPEIIELLSSPVAERSVHATTPPPQTVLINAAVPNDQLLYFASPLPDTVTKRRKKSPFRRYRTAPLSGVEDDDNGPYSPLTGPAEVTSIAPIHHDTVEAMDLASPSRAYAVSTPESPSSLPSPSMFRKPQPHPTEPTSNVVSASETRGGVSGIGTKPPNTITEWIRRSQSMTPGRSRFVDRLTSTQPDAVEDTTKVIDIMPSSMPTPPLWDDNEKRDIELDETDVLLSHEAASTVRQTIHHDDEDSQDTAPLVSVGSLLPATRYLRDKNASISPTKKPESRVTVLSAAPLDLSGPSTKFLVPNDSIQTTKAKTKKKKYVQPRGSLPGAWKYVDEVDLSGSEGLEQQPRRDQKGDGEGSRSYRKAFRMSEVEMVDLTGD